MTAALTAASTIANAPHAESDGPVARPAGYGLLAAANVLPTPPYGDMFGVDWEPPPCGAARYWVNPCSDETVPASKTFEDRPARIMTEPFVIYWGEECGSVGGFTDTDARVRAGLSQGESRAVEARLWSGELLTDSEDLGTGRGIIDALGHLEEELAGRTSSLGIIHAPVRIAPHAANANLIVYDGPVMRTPLGHAWAFGGGYDPLLGSPPTDGAVMVATGPMTLWRGPVITQGPVLDRSKNRYVAVAERIYSAGWDCASVRMALPLSA